MIEKDELDAMVREVPADIAAIDRQLAKQRLARDRALALHPTMLASELDALFEPGRLPALRATRA